MAWSDDARQRNSLVKSGSGGAETGYAVAKRRTKLRNATVTQIEALERHRGAKRGESTKCYGNAERGEEGYGLSQLLRR